MRAILFFVVPMLALLAWGALFDHRLRRRGGAETGHDIGAATRQARGQAEGRGGGRAGGGGDNGGMASGL
jgi:hypothetical protein